MKERKIALIGNYPPRKCGIATFTYDLNKGIKENGVVTEVVAMNDGYEKYFYPPDVCFDIEQNEVASYINAATYLNTNDFDAVILQHEFGIFGGRDGSHIIQLVKRLRIPVFTTLHTILDDPTPGQKYALEEIALYSQKCISMSYKGINILQSVYNIPEDRIYHIHHGVHKINLGNPDFYKKKFGVENKFVLLTFGLLSRNKSIEVVINALADVVKKYPQVVYIVLGATHPHVVKKDGEEYRYSLMGLVKKLNLEKHVIFINRFISNNELFEYLNGCDIYLIPYSVEKQITSGTLIYAMSAAKPIVSTPFWYAKEMLADNRGVFFNFGDAKQLSTILDDLMSDRNKRERLAQNAYNLAKECFWPKIGKQYIDMINTNIKGDREVKHKSGPYQITEIEDFKFTLPPLKLTQLIVLTDNTGILQHARYNVPERSHGYCTDDNARALMLSVMLQNDFQDTVELKKLISTYLSFIDYAYNPAVGRFRNFMTYNRNWMEEVGSEDCQGRVIWALGYISVHTNDASFYQHANYLFDKAIDIITHLKHPRAIAYAILGLTYHVEINYQETRISLLQTKADELYHIFDRTIDDKEWPWFDNVVTYANCRIPQALIATGLFLKKELLIQRGIKLLDWLIEKQFINGIFSPIGNNGWMTREGKAQFDQQPIEAHGMIDACLQAESFMKNGKYEDFALKAFAWFFGDNDLSIPLYDFASGGCRDGLQAHGVNLNQGAESTISWLMSFLSVSFYFKEKGFYL